ncbi:staygreen family protein [Heyndrickxia oleronia]|uniref:staygreen family protein n=1 Tax=Heyndrickxia oleronia TaxID=38875 RepID=UPI00203AEFE2|nr:staygreen family protein [Heyndrickxia oleronia]MCM3236406.1 staygreen family protein [Heyndrickxia oleronia]
MIDRFDNLSVNILPLATKLTPLQGRRYTLSHSEATGEWLVSIGLKGSKQITSFDLQNVIQAEWTTKMGEYVLLGKINIDSEANDKKLAQIRYMIYQKELPFLIKMIINSDRLFFNYYPLLLDAPIHIEFQSTSSQLYQTLFMGTPRKYLIEESVNT